MVQKLQDINFNIEVYNKKEVDELLSTSTDNLLSTISNLSANSTWKDVIEDNTTIGILTRPKLIKDTNGKTLTEIANYQVDLNCYNNSTSAEYSSLTLNKDLKTNSNQASIYYRNYKDASSRIENGLIVNKDGVEVKGKPLTIPEPLSDSHATTKAYVDNKIETINLDGVVKSINNTLPDENGKVTLNQLFADSDNEAYIIPITDIYNNWQQEQEINYRFSYLTYDGIKFFAPTLDDHGICYSETGQNWKQTSLISGSFYSVSFTGNKYFACSLQNGGIYISDDGLTWTRTNQTDGSFTRIIYAYGKYFAGTNSEQSTNINKTTGLYVSLDGLTWEKDINFGNDDSIFIESFIYTPKQLIAKGATNDLYITKNGEDWETIIVNSVIAFKQIIYANNKYLGTTFLNGIYKSEDGKIWEHTNQTTGTFYDIIYENNIYIALGAPGIYSSIDGNNWEFKGLEDQYFSNIKYGNGIYVATSVLDNSIYYSVEKYKIATKDYVLNSTTWKNVIESLNGSDANLPPIEKTINLNGNKIVILGNDKLKFSHFNNIDSSKYVSLELKDNNTEAKLYYKEIDEQTLSSNIENSIQVNLNGVEVKGKPLTIPEPLSDNHATTKAYVDNTLLSLDSNHIKYDIISYSGDELSLQLNKANFSRDNGSTLGYKLKVSDFIYYKPELTELEHCELTSLVINSLSITNGNSGAGLNTNPLYCVISEYDQLKQDINHGVKFVGVSNNAQNNTANTVMNFQFDGVEIEPDKLYIITFVLDNQISDVQTSDFQTVRLSLVKIPDDISSIVTHDYIGQSIGSNGSIYFRGDGNYTGNCSADFYPKYNKIVNVTVLDYNVSETVHTFGNEIISGEKTFTDEINFKQTDFSNELKDFVLENYNIDYPNITTTNSLQIVGNILQSEKYAYIRPEENRMFDSTTIVIQVKINKDTITNIPTELTSNIYSIDQKRLVQFELWSAGSLHVTALNTSNHGSNPNKISTRINSNWSTPITIPESKKLLIVWRFKHNSDTSMTIDSFINGSLAIQPVNFTQQIANSISMTLFRDINEDDPDWTIEKFEIYDKALTDEEIQGLTVYQNNNSIQLTPNSIYLNNPYKTNFKDNEYITKGYIDTQLSNTLNTMFSDISGNVNSTENIKALLLAISQKLGITIN